MARGHKEDTEIDREYAKGKTKIKWKKVCPLTLYFPSPSKEARL